MNDLSQHVPTEYNFSTRTGAERFARELLDNLGLSDLGWRFSWNRRKRAFGLCDYGKRTIFVSAFLFPTMTEDDIYTTIVHEAAHALAPGSGHGAKWKSIMRRLGIPAERCGQYTPEGQKKVAAEAKWLIKCPCGSVHAPRLRRPKKRMMDGHYHCRKCKGQVTVHRA